MVAEHVEMRSLDRVERQVPLRVGPHRLVVDAQVVRAGQQLDVAPDGDGRVEDRQNGRGDHHGSHPDNRSSRSRWPWPARAARTRQFAAGCRLPLRLTAARTSRTCASSLLVRSGWTAPQRDRCLQAIRDGFASGQTPRRTRSRVDASIRRTRTSCTFRAEPSVAPTSPDRWASRLCWNSPSKTAYATAGATAERYRRTARSTSARSARSSARDRGRVHGHRPGTSGSNNACERMSYHSRCIVASFRRRARHGGAKTLGQLGAARAEVATISSYRVTHSALYWRTHSMISSFLSLK